MVVRLGAVHDDGATEKKNKLFILSYITFIVIIFLGTLFMLEKNHLRPEHTKSHS